MQRNNTQLLEINTHVLFACPTVVWRAHKRCPNQRSGSKCVLRQPSNLRNEQLAHSTPKHGKQSRKATQQYYNNTARDRL